MFRERQGDRQDHAANYAFARHWHTDLDAQCSYGGKHRTAARCMGIGIPKPLCNQVAGWCVTPKGTKPESVLVDEAGGVLEDALGTQVAAVAINGDALRIANPAMPDLEAMGFLDLFRAWRRARKRKGEQ